ncbi:hypothetical protein RJ639_042218, partial [Escallonia herrerae]
MADTLSSKSSLLVNMSVTALGFEEFNHGYSRDANFGSLYFYLLEDTASAYTSMQVALLNGVTMGGGAGVSIPGTFRVATDKT